MKFSACTGKFSQLDLEPNSLETESIQIKPKFAKPFVIIAWYRPPKHKIDDILNIEKLYKNHDKSNTEVIIIGDSDCDDLPDQDKSSISLVIRTECKRTRFFTGYELIYCILKCLHTIQKNFFFVFKDKVICLLVRQSQYTVITYRGLRKKCKEETLVKADSLDVRKELSGIIMCGGWVGWGGGDENAIKTKK